jgi:hypothetical protein
LKKNIKGGKKMSWLLCRASRCLCSLLVRLLVAGGTLAPSLMLGVGEKKLLLPK